MIRQFTLACAVLLASFAVEASPAEEDAARLFENYVALEAAFDAAVADLYSDTAIITNKRRYPTGEVRETTLTGAEYKSLIRSSMWVAKLRGDTSTYSDVKYHADGERVTIDMNRHSNLKQYDSPLRLVVGPGPLGSEWLILEEHSHSRP